MWNGSSGPDIRPLIWLALFGAAVLVLGVTVGIVLLGRWLIMYLWF